MNVLSGVPYISPTDFVLGLLNIEFQIIDLRILFMSLLIFEFVLGLSKSRILIFKYFSKSFLFIYVLLYSEGSSTSI